MYLLSPTYIHKGKSVTLPRQTKQTPAPHPLHFVRLGRYLFDCLGRAFGAGRGLWHERHFVISFTYLQDTDEGFPPFRKRTRERA